MEEKKTSGKGLLGLLILIICVGFFGYFGYSNMGNIKLGLDLAGGVSITYQAKDANPTAEQMSDTIYKLQQRVQNYSTEAEVYQEGSNRINIDIPGVSDANSILQDLGKPGSLTFLDADYNTVVDGTMVTSARAGMDSSSGAKEYIVSLTFNDEGTKAFGDATTKGVGKPIYIVYDEQVVSAPVVREPITGGQCRIDGMKDYDEADKLAATIRIGSLSLELEELRSNVVGAKLGQEAISTSLKAGLVGFALVCLFMLAFYWIPGAAAVIALSLYIGLMLILLDAFDVTLTLPGIAGIILSIGMAVDANCIIFTRIREEIGLGKTVHSAIRTGFRKALSAIIDGNVTTLIAAAVLFWRGSGSVKGFATTLALGIVLSMFTALVVTRTAIFSLYHLGFKDKKFFGVKKDRKPIGFLKKRKLFIAGSLIVILIGLGAMAMNAGSGNGMLNYSMEFKGGTSTNVAFNEDMSLEDISSKVVPLIEEITGESGTQTQKVEGTNEVIFRTRTLNVDERETMNQMLADNFGVDKELITAESVSGVISNEMRQDAVIATVIATIAMLIYIWFRFKNLTFAVSSVLALVHDVLVTITFYAVLRWTVGSSFIACILTIVGYSINATIVIFDRIRENLKLRKREDTIEWTVDHSITQTLSRSINTSITTFIMVFVLYLMGVSSIRDFTLPLMVGIVSGAYSSVCLASALWFGLNRRSKNDAEKEIALRQAEEDEQKQKVTFKKKAKKTPEEKAAATAKREAEKAAERAREAEEAAKRARAEAEEALRVAREAEEAEAREAAAAAAAEEAAAEEIRTAREAAAGLTDKAEKAAEAAEEAAAGAEEEVEKISVDSVFKAAGRDDSGK